MNIKSIREFLLPSQVSVSKKVKKRGFSYFEKELNNIALNNDVFVHISESIKDPRLFNIKVLKKGYNHVVDIPDFAVKNQTGDSVYIAWEKELASADSKPFLPDITTKLNELLESIK